MKAVFLEEHGDVSQLQLKERADKQELRSTEVKLCVKHCALNHLDLWLRKGGTGDTFSLPVIPGSDIVGIIDQVGSEVAYVKPGDAVLVYPGISCAHCQECTRGNETRCKGFRIIGYHVDGGYAEQLVVDSKQLTKIPNENLKKWAAVPISYITAWNGMVRKARLQANDTVVIWGAAGGLGNAALKLATGLGATVIAIVSSEDKGIFLREQGFTGIIIQRSEDVVKKVREFTNKQGATVVLDHVGKATYNDSLKMLAKGGRLAFCGITTGPKVETDLRYIFGKQLELYGSWMGDKRDLHDVVSFLSKNEALLPHIDRVFSLEEAGEAQTCMEQGTHTGKIILNI